MDILKNYKHNLFAILIIIIKHRHHRRHHHHHYHHHKSSLGLQEVTVLGL